MAKRKQPEKIEANLSFQQMEAAIPKLDRRIVDLESFVARTPFFRHSFKGGRFVKVS